MKLHHRRLTREGHRGGICQRSWRKGRSTPFTSEIDSAKEKQNSDGRLQQALALSPGQPSIPHFFGRDKDTRGRHARVIHKVEFCGTRCTRGTEARSPYVRTHDTFHSRSISPACSRSTVLQSTLRSGTFVLNIVKLVAGIASWKKLEVSDCPRPEAKIQPLKG